MAPRTLYVIPLFTVAMGSVFAGFGVFGRREPDWLTLSLGSVFIIYGLALLAINLRAYRKRGTRI
jgi:hypothetical protein